MEYHVSQEPNISAVPTPKSSSFDVSTYAYIEARNHPNVSKWSVWDIDQPNQATKLELGVYPLDPST